MHDRDIVGTFMQTAESFNTAAVTRLPETLGMLLELAQPTSAQRWLDAACGPGIVSRALAPLVGDVVGVDRTPAMVDLARREAAAGVDNLRFSVGHVTDHVPAPARAVAELRRVVRPGGAVVIADHLGDDDADAPAHRLGSRRTSGAVQPVQNRR